MEVIGIHTPEFSIERNIENVRREVRELGLSYPIMMDNDYVYWKALENRYWPTVYLVDKDGYLRGYHVGETHIRSEGAKAVEEEIEKLLNEVERGR